MAKIGCLKPFRGSYSSLANIVLEDGEIAFETTNKRIYMGDGTNDISSLTPFINTGNNAPELWQVDANTITTGGTYYCSLTSNYPDGTSSVHTIGWMQVMTILNGAFLVQIFWNRAEQMWYRTRENYVWNSWHRVTIS